FFFQAADGIRDRNVTGVQTCALPILSHGRDAAGTGQQRLHPLLKMRARLSKTRAMCASLARSWSLPSPPQMQRYDCVLLAKIAEIGRASCREGGKSAGGAVWRERSAQ